jgi:hypothetical protein
VAATSICTNVSASDHTSIVNSVDIAFSCVAIRHAAVRSAVPADLLR